MLPFKVGDDVTIISKGIRHGYGGQTWIDELMKGSTSYLKITRIGTKYVYGIPFWIEDGQRKNAYYEADHNLNECIILLGVKPEWDTIHKQFRADLEAYEKLRDSTRYQFERELREHLEAKMKAWETEHPRPQNNRTPP